MTRRYGQNGEGQAVLSKILDIQVEDAIMKKGIQGTVDTLDFGHMDAEIKTAIIKRYNLSLEEAEEYIQNK